MAWLADLLKEIPSAARYKSELEAMARENEQLKEENTLLNSQIKIHQSKIEELRQEIQRRDDIIQNEKSHNNLLKDARMQWGCLKFRGDNRLYCPSCFHKTGKKIETSRVDIHNRYCAVCKTTIPSG